MAAQRKGSICFSSVQGVQTACKEEAVHNRQGSIRATSSPLLRTCEHSVSRP